MISINGQKYTYDVSKSLAEIFSTMNIPLLKGQGEAIVDKGIAAAVNEVVIPASQWSSYKVKDNDTILVIKATQGG